MVTSNIHRVKRNAFLQTMYFLNPSLTYTVNKEPMAHALISNKREEDGDRLVSGWQETFRDFPTVIAMNLCCLTFAE